MGDEIRTRATFLRIERPLIPAPPLDAQPSWYLSNTLGFYLNGTKVWEQEIPEAELGWRESAYDHRTADEFDKYFSCEVFKDGNFGWQLRATITHARAKKQYLRIMEDIEQHHKRHFAATPTERTPKAEAGTK